MGRLILRFRLAGLVVATGLAVALAGCTTVAAPPGPEAAVSSVKARPAAAAPATPATRTAAAPPRRIVVLGAGW